MTTTPHPETLAIRSGRHLTHCNEHSLPLFLTSSFLTESAEDARQLFAGEADGYTYFNVDVRTVERYIRGYADELSSNGFQILKGKKLNEFIEKIEQDKKTLL